MEIEFASLDDNLARFTLSGAKPGLCKRIPAGNDRRGADSCH